MSGAQKTPHAVCIPYPIQGHINPMLQLAKLLHARGFHITFVNTEYNHNRLLRNRGRVAMADRPSFRFRTIPDGLPPTDADSTQDISMLTASVEQNCPGYFKELIARLNNEAGDISCVVSDTGMFFTIDVVKEFGVPVVLLWTASACALWGYAQYQNLVDLGLVPFKDENFTTNGELDVVLDWVPTIMKGIRLGDMPTSIRTTDPKDFVLNFVIRVVQNLKKASAIIFNSFDALENGVLEALSSELPPVYTLGPLQLLLDSVESGIGDEIKSTGTSLWKEDTRCLEWLDSYEPNSVVYVSFGSVTVMTNDQLIEFAWGLANSNQPFLWIIRPDLVNGEFKKVDLPPEFLEKTNDRGFITSWCNQEQVLGHPAIGGFLTHCGWNSIIESLINGVPIICWPFFEDQPTNCWFSCNKWGIGMELNTNVKRSEVERQIKEMMKGDKGKEMKGKVMEWRRLAYEAIAAPNGPSYNNLDKVVDVLGLRHK